MLLGIFFFLKMLIFLKDINYFLKDNKQLLKDINGGNQVATYNVLLGRAKVGSKKDF